MYVAPWCYKWDWIGYIRVVWGIKQLTGANKLSIFKGSILCYFTGEIEVSIGQSWSCIFMFRVRISLIFEQKIAISLRGKIQTLSCRFALQGFFPPKKCEISKSGGNIFCTLPSAIIDYFIKEFGKMELFLCQKFLMNCRKLSRKVWIIKKMENKIWSW